MAFPQNTFSGNRLERASDRRNDPRWIAEQEQNPHALALTLWEGRPLIEDHAEGPRLAWLSMPHAMDLTRDRRAFLGLWRDAPVFAVEFEGAADPAAGPVMGLGAFYEMRAAAALLPGHEAAMAGAAKSLFDWRRRHGFCAACGTETLDSGGGWRRACPACRAEHFPRVDPVVIMLPIFEDRCLLGRQASWPAGRMSALAGFLEPGESIEEACAREVEEEAGLEVTAVRYHSSQPWPFPSQLMIGLICDVSHDRAAPDQTELEAVAWLTREEARAVLAGTHAEVLAPPPIAVARTLLQAWVDAED
ncbi:MAG: NAD(+) diphosphatase [Brevundimonas sp.]